ncbi:MAG: MarR family transcriptional regulator [Actinomycetota bacterium]|nr:MarR family transcriptional regulator [Actinomycetota bacterium]
MTAAGAVDAVAVGSLRLVLVRLVRRTRKHSDLGLTPSQLSALSTVDRHGPLRLGRLAELEQITKSSVTRLVARLEEEGILARIADSDDGRSSQVQLTDKGRRLMREGNVRADAYLGRQIAALTPEEQGRLFSVIPVLQRLLETKA